MKEQTLEYINQLKNQKMEVFIVTLQSIVRQSNAMVLHECYAEELRILKELSATKLQCMLLY
jgi:hypothetical protein